MEIDEASKLMNQKRIIYQDDLMQQLATNHLSNLNPRYALLSYNILNAHAAEEAADPQDMFDATPRLTIKPNHLFYHTTDDTATIDNLGKSITSGETVVSFDTTLFYHEKQSLQVLFNDESLTMLDLSLLSVELGIQLIGSGPIVAYCRANKLDGYVNLDDKPTTNGCFMDVQNHASFCPVFHILNGKKDKVLNKFKLLSNITLTYKKEHLSVLQIKQL